MSTTGDWAGPGTMTPGVRRAPLRRRSREARRWDWFRYALAGGLLLLTLATLVTGEREGTWREVRGLVAAGEVTTVRVVGELSTAGTGYSVVEVSWRDGSFGRRATVVHVRGDGEEREARAATAGGAPLVHAAPSSILTESQPGLRVIREQRASTGELLGWQVPSVIVWGALLLFLGVTVLLVAGPRPWRATPWAWFWLLFTGPLGFAALLLLAGPTPGVPTPGRPDRRLTGGWAFLLAMGLAAVFVSG